VSRLRAPGEVAAALLRCVADPGENWRTAGLAIGPDNDGRGFVNLSAAADLAAAGVCVAVIPRPDLLVLDFDRPDDPAAASALGQCVELLRLNGARLVRVASGRFGHVHVWAAGADAETRALIGQVARRAGIDVRNGTRVRPPGVQHRFGSGMALLEPATWEEALERLTARPDELESPSGSASGTPAGVPTSRPSPGADLAQLTADLPLRLRELLCDPSAVDSYGGDRSRLVMALCNVAANAGVRPERVLSLLLRPDVPSGAKVRSKTGRPGSISSPEGYFWHTWAKAQSTRHTRPVASRPDALARLAAVEAAAGEWRGPNPRTRGSDEAVLRGIVSIAARQGGVKVALAVRSVAEESGVHADTAAAAMKRLQTYGWLVRRRRHFEESAAVYEVMVPLDMDLAPDRGRSAQNPDTFTYPPGGVGLSETGALPRNHDVFRRGVLGKQAPACLEALAVRPLTAREMAAAIARNDGSVRRWLNRLSAVGLCERGDDGRWRLCGPVDSQRLDAVARMLSADGAGERQRLRHAQQRECFRRALVARHSPRPEEPADDVAAASERILNRVDGGRPRSTPPLQWRRQQRILAPLAGGSSSAPSAAAVEVAGGLGRAGP
jgi:hypothetical protein